MSDEKTTEKKPQPQKVDPNNLTPEQLAVMAEARERWTKLALGGDTTIDLEKVKPGIRRVFTLSNEVPPEDADIHIADSMPAAHQMAASFGCPNSVTAAIGLGPDAGWGSAYECYTKFQLLDEPLFRDFKAMCEGGLWDAILLAPGPAYDKTKAILIRRPELLKFDEQERLHCADGPAYKFCDGAAKYFWHHTEIPAKVIEEPESYTAEDIRAEQNSEILRALGERLGWARFMEKLGARMVDRWVDPNTELDYELYDLGEAQASGPRLPRMLKMKSPVLNGGEQPYYVEPVHPDLRTAQAARRSQFPLPGDGDPEYPTPDYCNAHPEMVFSIER